MAVGIRAPPRAQPHRTRGSRCGGADYAYCARVRVDRHRVAARARAHCVSCVLVGLLVLAGISN